MTYSLVIQQFQLYWTFAQFSLKFDWRHQSVRSRSHKFCVFSLWKRIMVLAQKQALPGCASRLLHRQSICMRQIAHKTKQRKNQNGPLLNDGPDEQVHTQPKLHLSSLRNRHSSQYKLPPHPVHSACKRTVHDFVTRSRLCSGICRLKCLVILEQWLIWSTS